MSTLAAILKRINQIISMVEYSLCTIILLVLVIAMSSDAFCRYFLGSSLSFAAPLSGFGLLWLGALASSVAYRNKGHISFSYIFDRVSEKVRKNLKIIEEILVITILVVVVYSGWNSLLIQRSQVVPGLGISKQWVSYALIMAFTAMILTSVGEVTEIMAKRDVEEVE